MTRTLLLLVTHVSLFAAGVTFGLLHARARRGQVSAALRAAETREIFVDQLLERRGAGVHASPSYAARHRADPHPTGEHAMIAAPRASLLPNATLAEAVAHLATLNARRIQEQRVATVLLADARRTWQLYWRDAKPRPLYPTRTA